MLSLRSSWRERERERNVFADTPQRLSKRRFVGARRIPPLQRELLRQIMLISARTAPPPPRGERSR